MMTEFCFDCGCVRDGVFIENKKKNDYGGTRGRHLPFQTNIKFVLMMVMIVTVVNVLGDDTRALQDTLSSLCSLNNNVGFGSCCRSYDINSVTLASSSTWNCFISSLSFTSESIINFMFVVLFLECVSHCSEALKGKD